MPAACAPRLERGSAVTLGAVREWLALHAPDLSVIETEVSTATVAQAAAAFGVAEGQIAKTLALRVGDRVLLVVARGDARLDNAKAKAAFGGRPRMLGADEVLALTGHAVGGVCPFGLATPLPVYCDVSLRAFAEVLPAGGSLTSAVRIPPERMAQVTKAQWVDVCRSPET
jgi:prolyl-tRNA editing enzyme YbaK/EbsC (Cys-tRNA(Pro) deacylase)